MGEVYRATDTNLKRDVAVKVLPDPLARDSERLARFQREAEVLARLNHPNIAQIHGLERTDRTTALVMELVDGPTLAERVAQSALPHSDALRIATQVAEALQAAHERGIIHRDLKPANIKVKPDGVVKVLDFGLAKALDVDRPGMPASASMSPTITTLEQTQQGVILGTPSYMSPEQAQGRPVDARSDIFSFGALLYEMLSGQRPFTGNSAIDTLAAVVRDEPPPLRGAPQLTAVVTRCMRKAPAMRYQTMAEVRTALHDVSGALAGASRPDEAPSIAVLPFANLSADKENEYFADGLAEEILNLLAKIRGLKVIARTSSFAFRGKEQDITAMAAALRVRHILEGSIRRAGTRMRVTAQLIDAADGSHVWSERYDREVTDVFAIQDEISGAISTALHVRLVPRVRIVDAEAQGTPSVDPEAYDAYLKGRYFFNRPSDENLQTAIARFEDAIALAPDFAPALSGLSDAYLWAGYNEGFISASEARPKAKAAAESAIRLDAESAEAHTSLAVFKLFYEYDREGSEAEFRRALERNSNYSYAHDQFALGLAFQSRFEESIAESRRAAELDPLNPVIPIDAAVALVWKGDREAAMQQVARAADLDPTFFLPALTHGWIEIQSGKAADAVPHFEQAKAMGAPAFVTAWLAYAYGVTGDRARALAEAEHLKLGSLGGRPSAFNSALVALGLGDHPRAVTLLEQAHALDSQWLGWLRNDRIFDPLRLDPRFRALLKKVGFEG